MKRGQKEEKESHLEAKYTLTSAHDRQVFVDNKQRKQQQHPAKHPILFSTSAEAQPTTHTPNKKFLPSSREPQAPNLSSSLFHFFFLLFLSRQTFLPQAFHPEENYHLTKPEPNRRHLTFQLTTPDQTGNHPSPVTIPPSSYFDLGLQCSIIAIKPANGASKKRCRVQEVEERKDGGYAFMRLAWLASLLVAVSLSMTRRDSSGGMRFSGGHAWLVEGEAEVEKRSQEKDKLGLGGVC